MAALGHMASSGLEVVLVTVKGVESFLASGTGFATNILCLFVFDWQLERFT